MRDDKMNARIETVQLGDMSLLIFNGGDCGLMNPTGVD
jgi:hypothetical protein